MALDLIAKFSVYKALDIKEAEAQFAQFLAPGEKIQFAYAHVRDHIVFTDKKIIAVDVQGWTGVKQEFRFFPYSKITSFSIETAGTLDLDSDFKIWVSGVGCFAVKFGIKLDIKELGRFFFNKIQ